MELAIPEAKLLLGPGYGSTDAFAVRSDQPLEAAGPETSNWVKVRSADGREAWGAKAWFKAGETRCRVSAGGKESTIKMAADHCASLGGSVIP